MRVCIRSATAMRSAGPRTRRACAAARRLRFESASASQIARTGRGAHRAACWPSRAPAAAAAPVSGASACVARPGPRASPPDPIAMDGPSYTHSCIPRRGWGGAGRAPRTQLAAAPLRLACNCPREPSRSLLSKSKCPSVPSSLPLSMTSTRLRADYLLTFCTQVIWCAIARAGACGPLQS